MSKSVLFTFGYEGLDLETFITRLKQNDIRYLIDIREKAISRKNGFSKNKLNEALLAENIIYLHYPDLGSPSAIRKKLRDFGDFHSFFEEYSQHLSSKQKSLLEILEMAENSNCCLLCFEKDHEKCHRKIVAQEINRINNNGMRLNHL